MIIKIVTPNGVVYSDEDVDKVSLPTTTGIITILEDHIPLVSIISPGEVTINKKSHEVNLSVSRGVIEIRDNSEIYILADTAERAEEIDIERAEQARKRAEEYLQKQEDLADVEFTHIRAQLEKELARISVARKYKKVRI